MPAKGGTLGADVPPPSGTPESPPSRAEAGVLVFTGGDAPPPGIRGALPRATLVLAADSGAEHALATGHRIDVLVGDLDSIGPGALDAAVAGGATVEEHPAAKDATDLELALEAARVRGARRVTVVGGGGGRLDHLLANALVLASPAFSDIEIDAWIGPAQVTVVRGARALTGRPGTRCSLLAVGGVARSVRTRGLLYPLDGEDLGPGSTRGISNELVTSAATVSLAAGTILAVQPDALEA
jgi:thiamine pyrophosphokinase